MKKLVFVFVAVFCFNNLASSQDFYIGLKTGLKKEVYCFTQEDVFNLLDCPSSTVLKYPLDVSAPTLQMVFRTTFSNNWEVETGIGWYNYSQKIKAKANKDLAFWLGFLHNPESFTRVLSTPNEHTFGCVHLSEKVGYRFKLSSNLHLRLNTGLQLGLLYNARTTSSTLVENDPFELYIIYHGVKKPYLNLLISNAVSLQYTTKSNFYFTVFASYHAGLFKVYQSEAYLANRKSSEIDFYDGHDLYIVCPITTRSSYFEFGIELGYTWKKKDKKTNNE